MIKTWNRLLRASLLSLSGLVLLSGQCVASQIEGVASQNEGVASQIEDVASQNEGAASPLTIQKCHLKGISQQVQCGTLQVPENYQQPEGKTIAVNFAVIPAIDNSADKEPLMFLAGGPGQAAVELAGGLHGAFKEVLKSRELILVDQRGTGKSAVLQCEQTQDINPYSSLPSDFDTSEVNKCLSELSNNGDTDLGQYNSENAIRDFDGIREALGHKQIAIYGGSYGTRAGLVYMRMFPESLSAVVLDSVGPIEVPIGLFGKSAARSFDMLLQGCKQEVACNMAFPNLAQEFQTLVERISQEPAKVSITHPRLGKPETLVVDKLKFISTLRMQLYSTQTRPFVPLVIHQAYLGNFVPFAGLTAMSDGTTGIYEALLFNIVCNEDVPRMTPKMIQEDALNNFGQDSSHLAWQEICPIWPQYRPSESFYQTVNADIPTLIISGDADPVTPPSNGDIAQKSLPNSKHLILKNSSHTPGMGNCAVTIINEFLNTKDPKGLDEACLEDLPAETFITDINGAP